MLIGALLAGIAVGLLLLARVFVLIPTDVRRLGVLTRAMREADPSPKVVVFGNSILMSGIDARTLTRALPGQPLAWNCASTGQVLLESYLLSQDLPDTIEIAIYGIFPRPASSPEDLHPQKYNTLFMNGYRPTKTTLEVVKRIYGPQEAELLERSTLAQVFASRWAIRQFVDTRARSFLRSDLALDKATFDLFHPQSYEKAIDPEITRRLVGKRLERLAAAPPILGSETLELARQIAREADARGRETIFLFAPLHPDLFETVRAEMLDVQGEFREALAGVPRVRVLNTADLLERNQFIDDMHPTNDGASILSQYLADSLRGEE